MQDIYKGRAITHALMTSRISWTVWILACSNFTLSPSICFSLIRPHSYPFATRLRSYINCVYKLARETSKTAIVRSPYFSLLCKAYNSTIILLRSSSLILPFSFNLNAYSSASRVNLVCISNCSTIRYFSLRYCRPSFLDY